MTDMSHRDASTDRLLRRHLTPAAEPATTDACLDGDTAGAWIAGRLGGVSLDAARAHVADCARCQALMATLARIEGQSAAVHGSDAPVRWWRWLVPVGVVAAMLAVVFLRPHEPPRAAPAVVQERAAEKQERDIPVLRPVPPATDEKKGAREERRFTEAQPRQAATAPPAAAAPPPASASAASAAPPPAPRTSALDKAQAAGASADAAPSRNLGALQGAAAANEMKDALRVDIVSPNGATRWRLTGASVEKSTDGGSTWTTIAVGVDARWTAGAAASATTFWLVARQGVVARTIDGRTFERVAFPETTDLSAIQATDAETATITTADGRSFRTTDGGKTWVLRLLQETPAAPFKD
jgi:hypothetical protein